MLTEAQFEKLWDIVLHLERKSPHKQCADELRDFIIAASAAPAEGRETEENVSLIAKMSAKLYTCHVANVSVAIDDFRDLLAYVHDLRCRIATAPTMSEAAISIVRKVRDTFRRDMEQGFVTKDKQFAVEMLSQALAEIERIDRAAAKGESDGPASD
jgi:hypothetical protein